MFCRFIKNFKPAGVVFYHFINTQLLPDRRGGRPESSLSLRSHGGGTPPPPGPGEGDATTPYSRSKAGSTVGSLLRETGGFNHSRESLIPSLHTGGSRRGRSFCRRLRLASVAWITERGDDIVRQRASSPLNISQRGYADTGKHRLRPADLATVIRQVSAFA